MYREVNGRMRKVRGGRLRPFTWGGPMPVLPRVQRRRDMERAQQEAKSRFPNLDAKLEKIAKSLREARISGRRFAYKQPLQDLYKMAYRWNGANKLKKCVENVAALRAIPVRANANLFSVLVRAVLDTDADRKNVSRWSVPLQRAMDRGIAPSDLDKHI
jgi:hypothetical protein